MSDTRRTAAWMPNRFYRAVLVDGSHGLHPADDNEPVAVAALYHHDACATADGESHTNASDAKLDFNERRTNEIVHSGFSRGPQASI